MKVRINAETLLCEHVDKKANIQYIIGKNQHDSEFQMQKK